MAGDWIKMRIDLQTHPKIVRILSATGSDKFRVIGGLHAVWSIFDTHSSDGRLHGYTPETLDDVIGWPGFAKAMIAVGWLVLESPETLALPSFDDHNGKSGKRRAEDQKRKRDGRKASADVRDQSDDVADNLRTKSGLEKRREDISTTDVVDMGGAKRATRRAPADWHPEAAQIEWAETSCPLVDIQAETEKFKDHTFGTARSDWVATWRNWMRKAQEYAAERKAKAPVQQGESFRERDERAKRRRWEEMTGQKWPESDPETTDNIIDAQVLEIPHGPTN